MGGSLPPQMKETPLDNKEFLPEKQASNAVEQERLRERGKITNKERDYVERQARKREEYEEKKRHEAVSYRATIYKIDR